MSLGDQRKAGVVRPARSQDLDCIAELWSAITLHHAHLDPLFRMRRDVMRRALASHYDDPSSFTLADLEHERVRLSWGV